MKRLPLLVLAVFGLVLCACGDGSENNNGPEEVKQLRLKVTTVPNAVEGTFYSATISAEGGKGSYMWSVVGGLLTPGLTLSAGTPDATLEGTPTTPGSFGFTIEVTDGGKRSAMHQFAMIVQPATPLAIATSNLIAGTLGSPYSQTIATVGGTKVAYTWAITSGSLPPGLTMSSSGTAAMLQGTPSQLGSFGFWLQVSDSIGGTASQAFTIAVYPPLVISTSSVPDAAVGIQYTQPLAATGGSGSGNTWSVVSGSLPPGLALIGSGLSASLEGSPSQSGSFTFTIEVADAKINGAVHQFSMNVVQVAPLSILTTSLPGATQHITYDAVLQSSGGAAPYSWNLLSGTLPPGIALIGASATASINGIPMSFGTFNFEVEIQGAYGMKADVTLSIMVLPNAVSIVAPANLPEATKGFEYASHLNATGGTPPYSPWQVVSGALPVGMELWDAPEGAMLMAMLPFNPQFLVPGSYSFTLQTQDALRAHTQKAFTVDVRDGSGPLVIATQYLGEWTTLYKVHSRLDAVGGTGQGFTWSLAPGSVLPPGVTLEVLPIPHLGGQPQTVGSFSFTVQVTDSASAAVQRTYTVAVADNGPMRPAFVPALGNHVVRERATFLVDTSGSMTGARIATVRAELTATIASLPPHYRFDVAAFGTQYGSANYYTKFLWEGLLESKPANKNAAIGWVNGPSLNASGNGCPTFPCLQRACIVYPPELKAMFLITDSYPDTGGSASQIVSQLPSHWTSFDECHLFGVSVGGGGVLFLQDLTATMGGTYIAI